MKAIDLYAGVGGWSLGLGMAGIEVAASYEWWPHANLTNSLNNGHASVEMDLRLADPSSFGFVEVVVGSPPCTHFSLANRGGKGNILEGLKDVEKFLDIVDQVRPHFWAMENVPRLATILQSEFNQGGFLHRFAHLNPTVAVLDASEWGVPQRRKRALIGNFDLDLLLSYRSSSPARTLGMVISDLASDPPVDPIYALALPNLNEHTKEAVLSWEEERINRDSKSYHPIYNGMAFPDDLSKPSRTVTATCTRVSRESIVVEEGEAFRRLTLREKACLQSFPAAYQFYAPTHSLKQKMVGNAFPPLMAYYVAHSMLGTSASEVLVPSEALKSWSPPQLPPPATKPDGSGKSYPPDRKFRAAIPGFRFKSGMRFELSNSFVGSKPMWELKFFFGSSKKVSQIPLGKDFLSWVKKNPKIKPMIARATKTIFEVGGIAEALDSESLQRVWCHRKDVGVHPYALVDSIGSACDLFAARECGDVAPEAVSSVLSSMGVPAGSSKVMRNSKLVFSGMVVCSVLNDMFDGQSILCEAKS